ncbi:Oidioi.mRNA.OKI2018_I69.chr2.g6236.t1.cds [Oikopleura dioica]|uniref:Oidioi.mRNA.OKI2018_I69.chr2.g6236.t1.cds n=1 Tax=Oikopleura dioica TaxID=34765 RepID=A0ABN7T2Y4_OIKDI|nr:Oidioi.mRNA.OKI2018_I69.chr2.g6236.t1.cds [Oikopleura dioica]
MLLPVLLVFIIGESKGEKKCGTDLREISKDGMASLHRAVHPLRSPDLECVQILLEEGADVNLQTSKGSTSLHLLFKGTEEESISVILDLFLQSSVDLSIKDESGYEAVHYLYQNQKLPDFFKADLVKKLIGAGSGHVSEELPWMAIDLPFFEKRLELLPGPPIPAAIKAVFEGEKDRFEKIKIVDCLQNATTLKEQLDQCQGNILKINEKNKEEEQRKKNEQESKIASLETALNDAKTKEKEMIQKATERENELEEKAKMVESKMRAILEKQKEENIIYENDLSLYKASFEEERKKAELLADEVASLNSKIEALGNVTCENKKENATAACPAVAVVSNELADERIEQLKMEKRKIIAFIIQILIIYAAWKVGKRCFRKKPEPGFSDIPSELTKHIEQLERVVEYNRGLQGAMNISLERKDAKIRDLQRTIDESGLFDESAESENPTSTEDYSTDSLRVIAGSN